MSEYVSTRGAYQDEPRSYGDVILEGLAPDRGLYVPAQYPTVSQQELVALSDFEYHDLFVAVRSKFVGDSIPVEQQDEMAKRAYTTEKFPSVADGNYVPVRQIGSKLFVQNLSLGPTAAFKDMALQAVAQDMDRELVLRGERLRVLGATSGDTGSAAEEALGKLATVDMFMLSPLNAKMTNFQKAQMAALSSRNVHNISIDVDFDGLQDMIKNIKMDPEFADLGAVNSINWARVASQVPYYFSGYFQAIEQSGLNVGAEVDFVVPSGNMGNAAAGYIAKRMGLPIRTIIVAANENDVLHRLIQEGIYVKKDTLFTSSPSMDIGKASNYERPVFDLLGNDPEQTRRYMEQFELTGAVSFEDIGRGDINLKAAGFDSGSAGEDTVLRTMRRLKEEGKGFVDPHTAVAVAVAYERGELEVPTICLETALPVKFEDTVREATGKIPEREPRFVDMEAALRRRGAFVVLRDETELKNFIRIH